jgi:hypothetical protein
MAKAPIAQARPVVANPVPGVPAAAIPAVAVAPTAAVPLASTPAPAKAAQPLPPESDEEHESMDWSTLIPSVLTSTVFHVAVVLALALYSIPSEEKKEQVIVSTVQEAPPEVEDFEEEELPKTDQNDEELVISDVPPEVTPTDPNLTEFSMATDPSEAEPATTSEVVFDAGDSMAIQGPSGQVGKGDSIGGRTVVGRAAKAKAGGGNKESEEAVERALKWLASVQAKDGGWNFDTKGINPAVTEPGSADQARNGATAMALAPFLAAGYTHKEKSPYQQVVYKGLDFLTQNVNKKYTNLQTGNVSWFENQGTMYSHGLAAMAMCEAYGMTKDKALLPYAQGGINFIATAQDPAGGGWRYAVRQPGDTSVVGWQVMAMKSGSMSYLTVNPNTIKGAINFLNSVSDEKDYRAYYGYTGPGKGPAQTAIGLLCRMHLGWKKDHQGLQTGVEFLSKMGPHKTNFYYNYYATQVLFQWGDDEFKKWNDVMRDQLIKTQSTKGADTGSWHSGTKDHSTEKGGRLYCTSLGTLILEVYYRYSKVLSKDAVDESFPL